MSYLVWVSDSIYAVSNDSGCGVFTCTAAEAVKYKETLATGGRIKYTANPGTRVGSAGDASVAHGAEMFRAEDQTSPEVMDLQYDDGDGYSSLTRYRHTCPWSGESWIVEERRKISGY